MKSNSPLLPKHLSGLALIELLGALVVLVIIFAMVVQIHRYATHQAYVAEQKHVALDAADQLMVQWYRSAGRIPSDDQGAITGHPRLRWRTRVVRRESSPVGPMEVVRFEMIDQKQVLVTLELIQREMPESP